MGRPGKDYPRPGKRCRGGRWRIYWRGGESTYEFSVGDVSENVAERMRLEVELALRGGDWPDWAADKSAVRRYLVETDTVCGGNVLAAYERSMRSEVCDAWADSMMSHLRDLRGQVDGLLEVTAEDVDVWLRSRIERGLSKATRNRGLTAARRFFSWAVGMGYVDEDPTDHASKIKEPRSGEIVYCTRDERDLIIECAEELFGPLSVWIAFYAGLRRSEVWRLSWDDVDMDRRRLRADGKTGPRVVPLADVLRDRLAEVENRSGWVCDRGGCETLLGAARKMKRSLREVDDLSDVDEDCIRWNAWRHTFGSLLAQDGVSIDKISAWMGNTPEVCRRHYAQFVPRDRHDDDIEKL